METTESGDMSKSVFRMSKDTIGSQVYIEDKTQVIVDDGIDYYTLTKRTFDAYSSPLSVIAYGSSSDAVVADYVVLKQLPSLGATERYPMVVTSVKQNFYDEALDEICVQVETYMGNTKYTFVSPISDGVFANVEDVVSRRNSTPSAHSVEPGDIIRITTDAYSKPIFAEMMFKARMPVPGPYSDSTPLGWLAGVTQPHYSSTVST